MRTTVRIIVCGAVALMSTAQTRAGISQLHHGLWQLERWEEWPLLPSLQLPKTMVKLTDTRPRLRCRHQGNGATDNDPDGGPHGGVFRVPGSQSSTRMTRFTETIRLVRPEA